MEAFTHQPVLLEAVLHALALRPDGIYVDATFGRGGHSRAILKSLGPTGRLIAMDRDPDAQLCAHSACFQDERFSFWAESFSQMGKVLQQLDVYGNVDGILVDLGVSSPQLDDATRGFSFSKAGPLDMRMNPTQGAPLLTRLQQAEEQEITRVLRHYGEERFASRIARQIKNHLADGKPLNTTTELAELIKRCVPFDGRKHPATRSFLAFRIWVNEELEEITALLQVAEGALKIGGRLAVITFHSIEDRIVKQHFIRKKPTPISGLVAGELPHHHPWRVLSKAQKPTMDEIQLNPRARSAHLRTAEKIT